VNSIELLYNICVVRENHDLLLADLQTCRLAALCFTPDDKLHHLDVGPRTSDVGHRTSDIGPRTSDLLSG
jgi:hypothetical protein